MKKKIKDAIVTFWDELFPEAGCELVYHHDYELVMAVMLSAQATDRSVNKVTAKLFAQYPTLEDIASARIADLEKMIMSLGMYHQKAHHLQVIARDLLERFDGKVPSDKADLMSLDGVGPKTANVVRAEWFKIPELAVDTHVSRIAKRLFFAHEDDSVEIVEVKLRKAFPPERYIKTHHQMIHFGRYFCKALHPRCAECRLTSYCRYFAHNKKG